MNTFSYVGICDFSNKEESLNTAQLFQLLCRQSGIRDRKLMIGVMMSYNTLTGQPSKYSAVWPKKEDISDIFVEHPFAFNTLHYADYEAETKITDLAAAAFWGGPRLHAIQLDMVWPNPEMIRALREMYPKIKIVLQVNRKSFALVGESPRRLVKELVLYGDTIDYVLLDRSQGEGKPMDAEFLLPFVEEISRRLLHLDLAVAGGLGPETVDLIKPLQGACPAISWDAQSKMRRSGNKMDPIDWPEAYQYLGRSITLLRS